MKNLLEYKKFYRENKSLDLKEYRNGFHIEPSIGWLNDPNGLVYFKGWYYIFHQFSPELTLTNKRELCWNLLKTKDFVNFEDCGPQFFPINEFDRDGVYSGCTFINDDKMYIYYTGNVKLVGDYNYITNGREHNTCLITSSDGIHFSEPKVVLTNDDYKNMSRHVRDPFVFKNKQGQFEMILGARDINDKGHVISYLSDDLVNWSKQNPLINTSKAYMLECPSYLEIDNNEIYIISPQGLKKEKHKFMNVYQSGYLLNTKDFDEFVELDYGFDFYAPTIFNSTQRNLMIGWVGMPDEPNYYNDTKKYGYEHCLTMVRELSVINNKLYQYPIEEYKSLIENDVKVIVDFIKLEKNNYYAKISVTNESSIKINDGLNITFNDNLIKLEYEKNIACNRDVRFIENINCEVVEIYCDTSCIEIYFNNGEKVFTSRFYNFDSKIELDKCNGTVQYMSEQKIKQNF